MTDFKVQSAVVGEKVDTRWRASKHGQDVARPGQLDSSAFTSGTHYNIGGDTDNIIPSGVAVTLLANGMYGPFEAVNEAQTVTLTGGPTGGTFTLTFSGQTTAAIAFDASAADVQAALEALGNIGIGDVSVTGDAGGPWTVVFSGEYTGVNVPQLTSNGSLTGGTEPAVAHATATGGSGAGELAGYINDDAGVPLGDSPSTADPTFALLVHGIVKASLLPVAAQRDAVLTAPSSGSFIYVED